MPTIIGIPLHIIIIGMPIVIIVVMRSHIAFIMSMVMPAVGIILQTMPSAVISQVIAQHGVGIIIGIIMPLFIIGMVIPFIMGMVIPFIIGIVIPFIIGMGMPFIIGIVMPFIIGICIMVGIVSVGICIAVIMVVPLIRWRTLRPPYLLTNDAPQPGTPQRIVAAEGRFPPLPRQDVNASV